MKGLTPDTPFGLARTIAMPAAHSLHPSRDQLIAFAHGRLPPEQMAEVESHIAKCDTCCSHLNQVPDDTLVQLAREAATFGFRQEDSSPLPEKSPSPGIPPELEGHPRYRVLGLVGSGGMGAVYKAEHRLMERLVALKVISPTFLKNAAAVDRFHREFKSAARLAHPNVVTAFDAEREGNLHFLVMEFVEGLSLDRLVQQAGQLSVARACHLMHQAALGLAHAHERGMVHRDIKPHNLMVGRKGHLKILDFGLARLASEHIVQAASAEASGSDRPGKTTAGMILGTPDYIAPEQAADARAADIRSDIYSLGCTLYFALTGQPPFPKGSFVEKLAQHATCEPTPIRTLRPDAPSELARVLEKMMAKDPARRYQTPRELASDLAPLAREEKVSAKRETAPLASAPAGETPARLRDPLANLAITPVANLPPVVRAGKGAGFQFGSPQLLSVILAGGLALAMVILAFPLANWLSPSGSPHEPNAGAPPASNSHVGLPAKPPAAVPAEAPAKQPLPHRVLLVMPRYGLWYADYADVKAELENRGVAVDTASSEMAPSELVKGSRPGEARPDMTLNGPIRVSDYGAIVFVGFDTSQYHPGSYFGDKVGQLLGEFKLKGRVIAAICAGQRALAAHGELNGKRVAYSQFAKEAYSQCGAKTQMTPVEADGKVITGATDQDAAEFAAAIIAALDAK